MLVLHTKCGTNASGAEAIAKTILAYDGLSRRTSETQELFDENSNARTITNIYDQAGDRITPIYDDPQDSTAASLVSGAIPVFGPA